MSSSSSIASNKDELMFLGKVCHHDHCNLHDFLPFSCPACKQSYCQEHFLPSVHSCKAPLPASMVDRIAPQCPMCDQVVSYPPGGRMDPNEAVEAHILSGTCTGMEGGEARKKAELRMKKETGKICYRRGCSKVIVVPMKCTECSRVFCPTHRHKSDHSCTPTPAASGANTPSGRQGAASAAGGKAAMSRFLSSNSSSAPASSSSSSRTATKPRPSPVAAVQAATPQLEARAAAAAAAMKRAGQDVKDVKVPFVKSKTEKRADAEIQSTIKALKARHDKGLLSKAEELKYAELVGKAESGRRKGEKDKDCIIA